MDNDEVENNKKQNKKVKLALEILIVILLLVILAFAGYYVYDIYLTQKFQDATIEIGTSLPDKVAFLTNKKYEANSDIITDLSKVDINKVGTYDVELTYKGRNEVVKLNLVDTTKPEVTFQDVFKNTGYQINANDFIKEMSDLSDLKVEIENVPDISKYGDYQVVVIVRDSSGNETRGTCNLTINWLRPTYTLELGKKLKKSDLVYLKADESKISDSQIDKINKSGVGEYEIKVELDGKTYTSKIKVQDTKAPTLTLKNVVFYKGENKKITKDSFIVKATDASGKVTTTLKTVLNTEKIGSQTVQIEAVDKNNNKVTKTAQLTVKLDNVGPVFSGLSSKTVAKHSTVNYNSGVSAVDAVEGKVSFTVNSSSVNTNKAGTYYATYTAKDSKGNTTTAKRKITVNHDQEDTNKKFNTFYNQNLAGKSVLSIVQTIRNKISYNHNWGGSDPVWYGLTNKAGNCYVHASLVKKALDKKGVTNKIIHTNDKTHYWNLVYEGGKWVHYDSTPGTHLIYAATDEEKYESSGMQHRDWNRNY